MDRVTLLRTTYRINAAATLACGLALLAAGNLLAPLFAVPGPALWAMGIFFVAFAGWILFISRRPQLLAGEAAAAGWLDAGYALASFASLAVFGAQMTPELRIAVALVAAPVALFSAVELSSIRAVRDAPEAEPGPRRA
jgi:hypothetical protein